MGSVEQLITDAGGPALATIEQELLNIRTHGLGNPDHDFPGLGWMARRVGLGPDERSRIEDLLRRAARHRTRNVASSLEALLGLTAETRGRSATTRTREAAARYDSEITADYFRTHVAKQLLLGLAPQCLDVMAETWFSQHVAISEWPAVLLENGWGEGLPPTPPERSPRRASRSRSRHRGSTQHLRLFDQP